MKLKKMIGGALVAATLGTVMLSGVAGADGTNPQTTGTGWDDKNDTITGGGSDTTYVWMQGAERLYNQAGGCRVITDKTSPVKGQCQTGTGQDATDNTGNWDHDATVSAYPTGSSAGVADLLGQDTGTGAPAHLYNYARSSRGPNASGDTGAVFWGYGKDALSMVTFGRSGDLSVQDIKDIYSCAKTDWSQVGGGSLGSGPIQPIGMNPASGTYGSMKTFLGFEPNAGACVAKDSSGNYPFENDVKQLNDVNFNKPNALWWMSAGEWKSFPFHRQDALLNTVGGKSSVNPTQVALNQYPATRFIYHVTLTGDAAPVGATDSVSGSSSGKSGAVREFTRFICKNSAELLLPV
jgi:hypothetical protein